MTEFVTIKHPSLPEADPARVTKRAFELIHQPKGWEVVGDAPATTTINVPSQTIVAQVQSVSADDVARAAEADEQAGLTTMDGDTVVLADTPAPAPVEEPAEPPRVPPPPATTGSRKAAASGDKEAEG